MRFVGITSDSYASDNMGDDTVLRKVGVGVLHSRSGCSAFVFTVRSVCDWEMNAITCLRGGGGVRAVARSVGVSTRAGR